MYVESTATRLPGQAPVVPHAIKEVLARRGAGHERRGRATAPAHRLTALDLPEVWGQDSFPASDPPSNW